MVIIPVKEGENIDRAMKRFKRKFERVGTMREIRVRKQYKKKSVIRREIRQNALYKLRKRQDEAITI